MRLSTDIRAIEKGYYEQLEYYRLYGIQAERIQRELDSQLETTSSLAFLAGANKLLGSIFDPNITATDLYAALEEITDEEIKVSKQPERELVEVKTSRDGISIEVTLHLSHNKRCYWEEVGTQEVPIYELRCEEE